VFKVSIGSIDRDQYIVNVVTTATELDLPGPFALGYRVKQHYRMRFDDMDNECIASDGKESHWDGLACIKQSRALFFPGTNPTKASFDAFIPATHLGNIDFWFNSQMQKETTGVMLYIP